MIPLMLAGAGVSAMGDMDKAAAVENAWKTYLSVMRAAMAARQQRNTEARTNLEALQPQHTQNLSTLISGMGDIGAATAGRTAATGQMTDAVNQARADTAGFGADATGGNTGALQTGQAAAAHNADRTGMLVNALAAARGAQAGDIARQGQLGNYGNAESTLAQQIQDIMAKLARVNGVDDEQAALRDVSSAQRMRFAQGVGDSSKQMGGYMNAAGSLYGAVGPGSGYGSLLRGLYGGPASYSNSPEATDRLQGPARG